MSEIDSPADALCALKDTSGRTILSAEYARSIADQFGVALKGRPGGLEPISRLDRLQPHNEDRGIGCGSLCKRLAEGIDGIEAEDFVAGGHGTTEDGLKDRNLPKIEAYVTEADAR